MPGSVVSAITSEQARLLYRNNRNVHADRDHHARPHFKLIPLIGFPFDCFIMRSSRLQTFFAASDGARAFPSEYILQECDLCQRADAHWNTSHVYQRHMLDMRTT